MVVAALAFNPRLNLLAVVFGLGLAFYLAIEPTPLWLLLLLAALVGLGTDAILRGHPASRVAGPTDTAVYLALPILATLAAGISLEHAVGGYWAVPVAAVVTPPFALLLYALYLSLEPSAPAYQTARLGVNAAAYVVAFAFYALTYEFDRGVVVAAFVVGLTSALLAVEILREGDDDIYRLSLYSGLVGLVMAQARWALNFTPLDDLLAAAFLLTAFYLATGPLQHHLAQRLSGRTAAEFATTALVALAIIAIARAIS